MQITNNPVLKNSQEDAFQNLQTAIVRLAIKPQARPGTQQHQDLNALVEQALEAYRKYMKAITD